jgi:SAM-dependent methyltransferase
MDSRTSRVRAFFQGGSYLESRAPIRARVEQVRQLLGDLNGKRILDLGCGDGSLSLQYARTNSVTLVDLSPRMLERARENTPQEARDRVRYVSCTAEAFTSDDRFDVVLCVGLLAHVGSVERTVQTVAHHLAVGGRCILQITDSDRWMGRTLIGLFSLRMRVRDRAGYDLNRLGCGELTRIATENGLRRLDERRTWSILPGMKLLPDGVLLRYQRTTASNTLLSSQGAEALVLFAR